MANTKVIIAGCGIAGPILALFLKQKGYEPVIYERTKTVTDAGLSLCLQPNGLAVISQIPGLVASLIGSPIERLLFYSELPEDKGVLADTDAPSKMKEAYGHSMLGVKRTAFHHALIDTAKKAGIEIVFGYRLVSLKQDEKSVTVTFENGNTATGSFVVGCDGLHSDTRACLFGKEQATYTGLSQCGGISPTPEVLHAQATIMNVFGNGSHFIAYPCNQFETSWATTRREPEAKETWRSMDQDAQDKFKQESMFLKWDTGVGELVRTAGKLVKYGLYDRPELSTWHQGRVVLLGDAAHPTSPHLGQGANQAFEDCNLLTQLLEQKNPEAAEPSTEILEKIFTEYEKARIPRSAEMVKGARQQGEQRVMEGVDACKQRNDRIRSIYIDDESIAKMYEKTLKVKQ